MMGKQHIFGFLIAVLGKYNTVGILIFVWACSPAQNSPSLFFASEFLSCFSLQEQEEGKEGGALPSNSFNCQQEHWDILSS